MSSSQCINIENDNLYNICKHLHQDQDQDQDYVKHFINEGFIYNLICHSCSKKVNEINDEMVSVSKAYFESIEQEGCWEGVSGQPEIRYKTSSLQFIHQIVRSPLNRESEIIAITPQHRNNKWFAVTSEFDLVEIDLQNIQNRKVVSIKGSSLNIEEKLDLTLSKSGRYLSIVNRHGSNGIVIDVLESKVTLNLNRGKYHVEQSVFPIAFIEKNKKEYLIHGTDWNRLDITELKTGNIVSQRSYESLEEDANKPETELDYFHGSLHVSQNQNWIVENGWIWHPSGVLTAFNLDTWITKNVWESEDGESRFSFNWCEYFWDRPLCWISDTTIAYWGYGLDDEWLIPAVCFFDVEKKEEVKWFGGPAPKSRQTSNMLFDEYLISIEEKGTSIWNIDGEQLLFEAGFIPNTYHYGSKHFLTLLDNGDIKLSTLKS